MAGLTRAPATGAGLLSLHIRPHRLWLHQTLNTGVAGARAGVGYPPLLAARRDGPGEELLLLFLLSFPGKPACGSGANPPREYGKTTLGVLAVAELGNMKVVLIPPTGTRRPGRARRNAGLPGVQRLHQRAMAQLSAPAVSRGRGGGEGITRQLPKQQKEPRQGRVRLSSRKAPGLLGKGGGGSPAQQLDAGQNPAVPPPASPKHAARMRTALVVMFPLPFLAQLLERVTSHDYHLQP